MAKQTTGKCAYCGSVLTRTGMTRHLDACPERAKAIEAANRSGKGSTQPIYHLVVRDAWDGMYWLQLEMNGRTNLDALDEYLRAIWLECCGHLSHFALGNDPWGGQEVGKTRKASQVLQPGLEMIHLYDYGTTSVTKIKVVAERQGKPLTRHPIALMARNDPPNIPCQECGEPATWYCAECQIEESKPGALCDQHAKGHPHDAYGGPITFYNSPRMGMCGYEGPAEPPY